MSSKDSSLSLHKRDYQVGDIYQNASRTPSRQTTSSTISSSFRETIPTSTNPAQNTTPSAKHSLTAKSSKFAEPAQIYSKLPTFRASESKHSSTHSHTTPLSPSRAHLDLSISSTQPYHVLSNDHSTHMEQRQRAEQSLTMVEEQIRQGLKDIALVDKYLRDEGCISLVHNLLGHGNSQIVSLDLRGNDIRRNGVKAIADLLRNNTSIQTLNLEWNFCGESASSGIEHLADALRSNSTLINLDLRNNRLTAEAGISLGRMIAMNRSVQHLDLRWNNLGVVGGRSLCDALAHNHHIRSVLVTGNKMPQELVKLIESYCLRNQSAAPSAGSSDNSSSSASSSTLSHSTPSSLQVTSLSLALSDAEARLAAAQQSLETAQSQVDALTTERGQLQERITLEMEARETERHNAAEAIQHLQQENQQLKKEVATLQEQRIIDVKRGDNLSSELDRLRVDYRTLSDERTRLSIAREQASLAQSLQLERLQNELAAKSKEVLALMNQHNEEVEEWEHKLLHQKKMLESEKELSLITATEKIKMLTNENIRLREEHSNQLEVVSTRAKHLAEEKLALEHTIALLRETAVKTQLKHEEELSRQEKRHLDELNGKALYQLELYESKIQALHQTREQLLQQADIAKQQHQLLLHSALQEKKDVEQSWTLEQKQHQATTELYTQLQKQHQTQMLSLKEKESQLYAVKLQNERLQHQVLDYQSQEQHTLEVVHLKHQEIVQQYEAKVHQLQRHVDELSQELNSCQRQISVYEDELLNKQHIVTQAFQSLQSSFNQLQTTVVSNVIHSPTTGTSHSSKTSSRLYAAHKLYSPMSASSSNSVATSSLPSSTTTTSGSSAAPVHTTPQKRVSAVSSTPTTTAATVTAAKSTSQTSQVGSPKAASKPTPVKTSTTTTAATTTTSTSTAATATATATGRTSSPASPSNGQVAKAHAAHIPTHPHTHSQSHSTQQQSQHHHVSHSQQVHHHHQQHHQSHPASTTSPSHTSPGQSSQTRRVTTSGTPTSASASASSLNASRDEFSHSLSYSQDKLDTSSTSYHKATASPAQSHHPHASQARHDYEPDDAEEVEEEEPEIEFEEDDGNF